MSSNAELRGYFIIIPRPLAKETAKLIENCALM
jgi:hypothetical protein